MKNNQFVVVLIGLLLVSTLITAMQITRYYLAVKQFQSLQSRYMAVNQSRSLVQSLINDTLDYSKRNPAIDPLLQSVQLKGPVQKPAGGTSGAVAPAPASKPAAK